MEGRCGSRGISTRARAFPSRPLARSGSSRHTRARPRPPGLSARLRRRPGSSRPSPPDRGENGMSTIERYPRKFVPTSPPFRSGDSRPDASPGGIRNPVKWAWQEAWRLLWGCGVVGGFTFCRPPGPEPRKVGGEARYLHFKDFNLAGWKNSPGAATPPEKRWQRCNSAPLNSAPI